MGVNKNVCVITNAFQETTLIENCIKQFQPYNLFHLVLSPYKSWNGGLYQDETPALAKEAGADLVIEGEWESAKQQFNYGLNIMAPEYQWAIICDADERYEHDEIEYFLDVIDGCDSDSIITKNWEVYWKSREYKITPRQTDYPVIAVRTNQHMQNIRNPHASTSYCDVKMHHFSYVRSDEEMLKKIKTFEASKEFQVEEWYKNKWLPWRHDMLDLHPVNPEQFKMAVRDSAPEEILL